MRQYQTTSKRFWAGVIDWLILFPVELFGRYLLETYDSLVLQISWLIFINLLVILYSVLLHGFFGQTFGKMLMRIKVIDVSEKRNITFRQALFRDNFTIISVLIFIPLIIYQIVSKGETPFISSALIVLNNAQILWFLLEIITCLFSEKRRAIHDFIAGTVVVKTEYADRLPNEKLA